jgi:hypothetical protein
LTFNTVAFFAAAKKVGAAPHRGEPNRPKTKQGKANTIRKPPKPPQAKTAQQHYKKPQKNPNNQTKPRTKT